MIYSVVIDLISSISYIYLMRCLICGSAITCYRFLIENFRYANIDNVTIYQAKTIYVSAGI
jgi:hypothetical protein